MFMSETKDKDTVTLNLSIVPDDFNFEEVKDGDDEIHITQSNWDKIQELSKKYNKTVDEVIVDIFRQVLEDVSSQA